jgi:hypothetical protein
MVIVIDGGRICLQSDCINDYDAIKGSTMHRKKRAFTARTKRNPWRSNMPMKRLYQWQWCDWRRDYTSEKDSLSQLAPNVIDGGRKCLWSICINDYDAIEGSTIMHPRLTIIHLKRDLFGNVLGCSIHTTFASTTRDVPACLLMVIESMEVEYAYKRIVSMTMMQLKARLCIGKRRAFTARTKRNRWRSNMPMKRLYQ